MLNVKVVPNATDKFDGEKLNTRTCYVLYQTSVNAPS